MVERKAQDDFAHFLRTCRGEWCNEQLADDNASQSEAPQRLLDMLVKIGDYDAAEETVQITETALNKARCQLCLISHTLLAPDGITSENLMLLRDRVRGFWRFEVLRPLLLALIERLHERAVGDGVLREWQHVLIEMFSCVLLDHKPSEEGVQYFVDLNKMIMRSVQYRDRTDLIESAFQRAEKFVPSGDMGLLIARHNAMLAHLSPNDLRQREGEMLALTEQVFCSGQWPVLMDACLMMARFYEHIKNFEKAYLYAQQTYVLAERFERNMLCVSMLGVMGNALLQTGQQQQAWRVLKIWRQRRQTIPQTHLSDGHFNGIMGQYYYRQQDYARAAKYYQAAVHSYDQAGNGNNRSRCQIALAQCLTRLSKWDEALAVCADAHDFLYKKKKSAEGKEPPVDLIVALHTAGWTHLKANEKVLAIERLERALAEARLLKDETLRQHKIALIQKDLDDARSL